ncbi:MAG: AraC family transcriptional regulator [Clostridiales bacterium]|nr:AraC family transcriptional regulator [Clostridiales bacterium]
MCIYNDLHVAVNYIEENIKKKITLEDIAESLFISKYHFHRIFKLVTNKKLMEYVRMRKLSLSLNDLLYTDLKIQDIALEYGFEHEQSYSRSFKKVFGISPSQFRLEKKQVTIMDKLDLNAIKAVEQGIILSPTFVIRPDFYIVGTPYKVLVGENLETNIANKLARDFFYNEKKRITNALNPNVLISLSAYSKITADESLYLPSIEVLDLSSIPEGMMEKKIPTHKYAVFKYIGPHSCDHITLNTLANIYGHIHAWLYHSQYAQATNFHFELIDTRISKDDYCEADIYLPVKMKE